MSWTESFPYQESDEDHLAYHDGSDRLCPFCTESALETAELASEHALLHPAITVPEIQVLATGFRFATDLDQLVTEIGAWADTVFATACAGCGRPTSDPRDCGCPAGTVVIYRGPSLVEHLRREIAELAAKPQDMEELADCFLLLAHLAYQNRKVFGTDRLSVAVQAKIEKNKRRKWGAPDVQGVISHVKDDA